MFLSLWEIESEEKKEGERQEKRRVGITAVRQTVAICKERNFASSRQDLNPWQTIFCFIGDIHLLFYTCTIYCKILTEDVCPDLRSVCRLLKRRERERKGKREQITTERKSLYPCFQSCLSFLDICVSQSKTDVVYGFNFGLTHAAGVLFLAPRCWRRLLVAGTSVHTRFKRRLLSLQLLHTFKTSVSS